MPSLLINKKQPSSYMEKMHVNDKGYQHPRSNKYFFVIFIQCLYQHCQNRIVVLCCFLCYTDNLTISVFLSYRVGGSLDGSQPERKTIGYLLNLLEEIIISFSKRDYAISLLLDLRNKFDTVKFNYAS